MTTIQGILHTKDYINFTINDDNDDNNNNGSILFEFSDASCAKGCLPGDTVIWQNTKCVLKEHGQHELIVGMLELASKTTYGLNARGYSLYLFVPYNRSYPPFIVGSSEKDRSYNQLGIIKVEHWDAVKSQFPRGALQTLFGRAGDLKAEEEALRWFAHPWPSLRNKHVDIIDIKEEAEFDKTRTLLTGKTFNIDPAGCKDIDDVITIESLSVNTWQITITIADVASYIEEMSANDILASTFGQTLYRDGEAICPMLSPSYSEDACSLIKGKERRGVSLGFIWNSEENIIYNSKWFECIFTNNISYTYNEFQILESDDRNILKKVASCIEQKDLIDSHEWIEAMMKFYNIEAGKLLKDVGVGILRTHSAPIIERLTKYTKMDSSLAILANSAAQYCLASDLETNHYGIGVSAYCHASSPIRRYADLMNQRILKQIIRGNREGLCVSVPVEDLNKRAKAAKAYEKNIIFLRAVLGDVRYLSGIRILDICDSTIKVWIYQWQKAVNIRMKRNADGMFISDDEKMIYNLHEGDTINLEFALNTGARHWKERIIIKII